ncbi:unnamed protein product [Adineta ricciae]|uniref:Arrestin C-terminal-like domain-containing protein n=1 Tax=Adineta ricciae TaxID=249248 RepID=A0A815PKI4_ADIRI|nr:unnamed protein product [Adineta ricciae]
MGASESTSIHVSFNRSNLFYFAGEQITGNIAFQNTHDKLTLDEIFLEFVGEAGYTTRETRRHHDNNGRSHTEYYTEYHQIPFMIHRIPVVQPQQGQRELTLYRGQYSWPFEFTLPQCLPPSSLPLRVAYPYVKYYVRIVLDKSWYKPNAKQVYPLTIFPRVNICQHPSSSQAMLVSQTNRKKVNLQGRIVQNGVVPGEKLSLELQLQNPKRVEIKRIEATFIQHRQIGQSQQSETIFRMELPDVREFSDMNLHRTFDLYIPSGYLSPTYVYATQCCGPALGIAYNYELKLDVHVRGLFTDFKVNIPVLVGTDTSYDHAPVHIINNFDEQSIPSAPAFDYEEPPPSYESIVTNGKQ